MHGAQALSWWLHAEKGTMCSMASCCAGHVDNSNLCVCI